MAQVLVSNTTGNQGRRWRWLTVGCATAGWLLGLAAMPVMKPNTLRGDMRGIATAVGNTMGNTVMMPGAIAQPFRPADAWPEVYERLPDLPREDHYISRSASEPNPSENLVSRMIRYHVYVKSRPIQYRLDWKLTIADYLGAHQWITADLYPGASSLRSNPLDGDTAVISSMSRAQRDQLVQALVDVFNNSSSNSAESTPAAPQPSPESNPQPPAQLPSQPPAQPQPGDAQLLL